MPGSTRAFILLMAALLMTTPVLAQQTNGVTVSIVVRDEAGYPIEGALVTVDPLGWEAAAGADGRVVWQEMPLDHAYLLTTVTIQADGYGIWVYNDLRLIQGQELVLAPILKLDPDSLTIPKPEYAASGEFLQDDPGSFQSYLNSIDLSSPMPATIRLRRTANPLVCDPNAAYTIEVVDFLEYVRNVLPNEWAPLWHQEALQAGAVAVKMYAWYWVSRGGKWSDADLMDSTCDQVYIPDSVHPRTDDAIRATWGWKMDRAGDLFQPQHLRRCDLPSCMDQDLSVQLAWQGYNWQELLGHFYPGNELKDNGYPYILHLYLPAVISKFESTPYHR